MHPFQLLTFLACGASPQKPAGPAAPPTTPSTGPFTVPEGEDDDLVESLAAWNAPPFLIRLEAGPELEPTSARFEHLSTSADGIAVAWGELGEDRRSAYHVVGTAGTLWKGRSPRIDGAWTRADSLVLATEEGLWTFAAGQTEPVIHPEMLGDVFAPGRVASSRSGEVHLGSLPGGEEVHRFIGEESGWPRLRSDGGQLVIEHEEVEPNAISVWDVSGAKPTRLARHTLKGRGNLNEVGGHLRLEDDRGLFRIVGGELIPVGPVSLAGSALLGGADRTDHVYEALQAMELPQTVTSNPMNGSWAAVFAEGQDPADDDDDDLWQPALAAPHGAPARHRLARLHIDMEAVTRVWRPATPPTAEGGYNIRAYAVVEGLGGHGSSDARAVMVEWIDDLPVGTAVALDGRVVAKRTFTVKGLDGKPALEADEDGPGTCSPEYDGLWISPGRLLFGCGEKLWVWSVDPDTVEPFGKSPGVERLLLAADGAHVLGVGSGALHRWSLANGKHAVAKLKGHQDLFQVHAVPGSATPSSPVGDVVLASETAGLVRLDAATGEVRWSHGPYDEGRLWEAAVSPDGRRLALAPEFGPSLVIADAATGKMLRREEFGGTVWDLNWTADSQHILVDDMLLDASTLGAVAETRVVFDTSWVQARLADGSWLVSDAAGRLLHVPSGGYGEGP